MLLLADLGRASVPLQQHIRLKEAAHTRLWGQPAAPDSRHVPRRLRLSPERQGPQVKAMQSGPLMPASANGEQCPSFQAAHGHSMIPCESTPQMQCENMGVQPRCCLLSVRHLRSQQGFMCIRQGSPSRRTGFACPLSISGLQPLPSNCSCSPRAAAGRGCANLRALAFILSRVCSSCWCP